MPNHNNKPYQILVLTPVNRKYIDITPRNTNTNSDDVRTIIRIISGRLECDSISIQYIKTSNTCLQGVYEKSLYIGFSKFNTNKIFKYIQNGLNFQNKVYFQFYFKNILFSLILGYY